MQHHVEGNTRHGRRSLRRAVALETAVVSDLWDGAVPLLATDLSLHGMWLQSQLSLDPGAELLVSLVPPGWACDEPFVALAEVARVGMFRRQRDARDSGMGLTFVDFDRAHEQRLREALQGLPPPLPKRNIVRPPPLPVQRAVRLAARAPALQHPSIEEVGRLPQITLGNGMTFSLRAEGELLTAGRGPVELGGARSAGSNSRRDSEPARGRVVRLSSPMSAILAHCDEPRLPSLHVLSA